MYTPALLLLLALTATATDFRTSPIDKDATWYTGTMLDDRSIDQPCPTPGLLQCDHAQDSLTDAPGFYYCTPDRVWERKSCPKFTNCSERANLLGRHCRVKFSPWVLVGQSVDTKL